MHEMPIGTRALFVLLPPRYHLNSAPGVSLGAEEGRGSSQPRVGVSRRRGKLSEVFFPLLPPVRLSEKQMGFKVLPARSLPANLRDELLPNPRPGGDPSVRPLHGSAKPGSLQALSFGPGALEQATAGMPFEATPQPSARPLYIARRGLSISQQRKRGRDLQFQADNL